MIIEVRTQKALSASRVSRLFYSKVFNERVDFKSDPKIDNHNENFRRHGGGVEVKSQNV